MEMTVINPATGDASRESVIPDIANAAGWACEQLLLRFFAYLDDGDFDRLSALPNPAGVWERGATLRADDGSLIRELLARSPTNVVHRLLSNFLVERADADTLDARAYLRAYRHEGLGHAGPAPLGAPARPVALMVCRCRFERHDDALTIRRSRDDLPRLVRTECQS
jgi:hypothetical protein